MKIPRSIGLPKLASIALLLLVAPTVGIFALANGSLLDSVSADSTGATSRERAAPALDVAVQPATLRAVGPVPLTPIENGGAPETRDAEETLEVVRAAAPEADLQLSTTVDNASPALGSAVTLTITLTHASGTVDATNIMVVDLLPMGLSYATHSADQGSYEPGSGAWDVGTVRMGTSVDLRITAVVTGTSPVTNSAEIVRVSEDDPDSTPNNHVLSEDDQDAVSLAALPEAGIELSATLYEMAGDVVVFALVLTNAGPSAASDIVVKSRPPAGLRYTGHVADQGDYDPITGVWSVGTVPSGAELTLHISATAETTSGGIAGL